MNANGNHSQQIVNKAKSYAHVLRDDGLSYLAYTEQITFLLFLKMLHEQTQPPYNRPNPIPPDEDGNEYGWHKLLEADGDELERLYRHTLEHLARQDGMLGEAFKKAKPEIQNPATLKRLIIDLIDSENWLSLDADVKGDIYEGMLEWMAAESPKGAGQYFTPRELIKAIVDVMQPSPDDGVYDPACGTGGFLIRAFEQVSNEYGGQLDRDQKKHLKRGFVQGAELVPNTGRLGLMNLFLHGINSDPPPIRSGEDALASDPGQRYSMVMTNPPFGKKSSFTVVTDSGEVEKEDYAYERQDFWVTTKNKQLNFVQHVHTTLAQHGTCAIVVPDNVLFEGGTGETIRRNLLQQCDVHTLLRLPTRIFYAQGVKANVLFFDKKPAREQPWTSQLWVYDLRTNKHFTLKENPLRREDLEEFVQCYNPANRHERTPTWSEDNPNGRWRCFDYDELMKRDKVNLDLFWLRDESLEDSEALPEPDVLAREIADDLQTALEQFSSVADELARQDGQER